MPRLLASPDKFRGTLDGPEAAAAIAAAGRAAGWEVDEVAVSDGGEGFLDCFAGRGRVRTSPVHDALGRPVTAEWLLLEDGVTAVVETARAIGLAQVGGATGNDPLAASSAGAGQLLAAAVVGGARRLLVGLGGSATTDGGAGAVAALGGGVRLAGVEVVVACDVTTRFIDAARTFAPQKGATPAQVALLRRRLERLAQIYVRDYGVDVCEEPGSGAAGGLAGGLCAAGALLVPGFDVVAEALSLAERIAAADLVVTGEGYLDEHSFTGKAVGGVVALAGSAGVPVAAVVGDADPDVEVPAGVEVVSLVDRFGEARARHETATCLTEVVAQLLAERAGHAPD
ncbi:MAG: glycerate kinase [Acidimicrobiales bacterium]